MADERSFQEMLEYRLAILKIESAFEACTQFGKANKKAFYKEIRHRLSQHSANGRAKHLRLLTMRNPDSAIAVLS
jgi:hypothetical protein